MSLLIWGAGAIGGTIGAYLARADYSVMFVDRERARVEAINADGFSPGCSRSRLDLEQPHLIVFDPVVGLNPASRPG